MYRRIALFLALAAAPYLCWAFQQASSTGQLQGHLKILSMKEVDAADANVAAVTPEMYEQFPLVVLSSDGKQTVRVVTADKQGNYAVALPPGSYLLDVQDRVRKHVRARPVPFTVTAGQTTRANLEMDTGIR
jgi:hypothetical protein